MPRTLSRLVSLFIDSRILESHHNANISLDQGQGAGQAIEDAATLSIVLPKGTSPEDVPGRLHLYEKIRYDRAHNIQEFSRQAGADWVDGKPKLDSKHAMLFALEIDCLFAHLSSQDS